MSDCAFLNKHRITEPCSSVMHHLVTCESDGWTGMFRFTLKGHLIRCVASDSGGWQHVSISQEYENKLPTWGMMCAIKELFWEDEDWVVQFHPAKSQYVNCHPYVLHLWRYVGGGPFQQPTPHYLTVGPK